MAQTDQKGGNPASSVRKAYDRCLQARRQWLSVRGRTASQNYREKAHADLHESVMSWFEALMPHIAERPGEVKQLWESAPLYPVRPATEDVLQCASGHVFSTDEADVDHTDLCPECRTPLEPDERKITDDEGRPLYDWQQGLKHLSSWSHQTQKETVSGGELSNEERVIERPQRLDPEILMRAARYLDLAAEECGLLDDTRDALPTGQL